MNNLEQQFQGRIGKIEGLIQDIEGSADEAAQGTARELVQALLSLHGAGLERMLDLIFESKSSGLALIDELAADDLVGSLLLLHELHPLDLRSRVEAALEKVRPQLAHHGGDVELLDVSPEGVVKLHLEGSCQGCPSSQLTLKFTIENAIHAAAPDVTGIEVEDVTPVRATAPAGFVPMASLLPAQGPVYLNGVGGN